LIQIKLRRTPHLMVGIMNELAEMIVTIFPQHGRPATHAAGFQTEPPPTEKLCTRRAAA
jgi:hypothetical protein